MTHFFVIVPNHPRAKKGFNVWRCDKCDSEAIFKAKYDKATVNRVIEIKIPCIPKAKN